MKISNAKYLGSKEREALIDLEIPENFNRNLLVFIHGYMGFKDWGPWNMMQRFFIQKGFGFCKFNMTHNGTTLEHPFDFVDLEAFGNNCYSYEKQDVVHVLDWLEEKINITNCSVHLIGHSRGGGIALLSSSDSRVSSVTTLAAISSIEKRFSFDFLTIEEWQRTGVRYIRNSRTNQDLPHNYSQYTDFLENKDNLSIQSTCEELKKPMLLIHGDNDESVSISEGYELARWTKTELQVIPEATHTFGGAHPYDAPMLPAHLQECCNRIIEFIEKQQH
jgi:pimeloyl-ACP methyl ester carboxylesterase